MRGAIVLFNGYSTVFVNSVAYWIVDNFALLQKKSGKFSK